MAGAVEHAAPAGGGGRPAEADDAELHEEERDLAEGRGGPHAPEGTPVATRPRVATPALGAAPSSAPRPPAGAPRGRSREACRTLLPRRRASPAWRRPCRDRRRSRCCRGGTRA